MIVSWWKQLRKRRWWFLHESYWHSRIYLWHSYTAQINIMSPSKLERNLWWRNSGHHVRRSRRWPSPRGTFHKFGHRCSHVRVKIAETSGHQWAVETRRGTGTGSRIQGQQEVSTFTSAPPSQLFMCFQLISFSCVRSVVWWIFQKAYRTRW